MKQRQQDLGWQRLVEEMEGAHFTVIASNRALQRACRNEDVKPDHIRSTGQEAMRRGNWLTWFLVRVLDIECGHRAAIDIELDPSRDVVPAAAAASMRVAALPATSTAGTRAGLPTRLGVLGGRHCTRNKEQMTHKN